MECVFKQTILSIACKIDKSYTFVIRLLSTSSHLSSLTSETSHTLLSPLSSHSTKKLALWPNKLAGIVEIEKQIK